MEKTVDLAAEGRAANRPVDLAVVAALPLFSGLSPECLAHLIAYSGVARYGTNETIFHQGEDARHLHVLLDGQVGLVGGVSDGEETVVEILRPGEDFIAAAVLTARPYLMGARALQACCILEIPAERLRRDILSHAELAVAMLTSLANHFRNLVREVKDLKLMSAAQRLAVYLVGLAPKCDGAVMVRLPYQKAIIAARIGVRAETLSRAFTALRDHGVTLDGMVVHISDLERLSAFCNAGDEVI